MDEDLNLSLVSNREGVNGMNEAGPEHAGDPFTVKEPFHDQRFGLIARPVHFDKVSVVGRLGRSFEEVNHLSPFFHWSGLQRINVSLLTYQDAEQGATVATTTPLNQ